jgi:hypothetical protein
MKRIGILFLFILISCSEDDLSTTKYSFYNSTEYELNIVASNISIGNNDFSYNINPQESISFTLSDFTGLFDFIPIIQTDRVFDYKFNISDSFDYRIIDYEYEIKYVVSGTANSALITYNTSSGGTGQTTRSLPYELSYKNFGDDWVYLSAQGEDGYGYVIVEIFVEDNLKYTSQAGGFNIATVSGDWINLYY